MHGRRLQSTRRSRFELRRFAPSACALTSALLCLLTLTATPAQAQPAPRAPAPHHDNGANGDAIADNDAPRPSANLHAPSRREHAPTIAPGGLQRRALNDAFSGLNRVDELRAQLAQARLLVDHSELEIALPIYLELHKAHPDQAWLTAELGYVMVWFGRYNEALPFLRRAVKGDPLDTTAALGLAAAHDALGQEPQALRMYQRVLTLKPSHPVALFNLGRLQYARGDFEASERTYRDLIARHPDDWKAYNNLGLVLLERGQPTAAIAPLRRALRLRPNDPGALYNIGRAYTARNDPRTALRHYERALERWGPDDIGAVSLHFARGNALFALRRYPDAIAAYQHALRLDPQFTDAWLNLGAALANAQRYPEAIAAFERAVEHRPERAAIHHQIALCYLNRQDYDAALARLNVAQRVDQSDPETFVLRAQIHQARGDAAQRRAALQRACALGHRSSCRR